MSYGFNKGLPSSRQKILSGSGSQPGVILPPRGTFGNAWRHLVAQLVEGGQATGIWGPGGGDAATHPARHRTVPQGYPALKVGEACSEYYMDVEAPSPSFLVSGSGHEILSVATAFVL